MISKTTSDFTDEDIPLYGPSKESRRGLNVPELIFTYGNRKKHMTRMPWLLPKILRAALNRLRGYRDVKRNPAQGRPWAYDETIDAVRELALSLGCRSVGFAEVPANLVFSNKNTAFSHAIVLTMDMEKNRISKAPRFAAGREVWRTYDRLGRVVNKIAGFLRDQGYGAQAGAAIGGDVNYPRLAELAGLGRIGHHGILISPDCGPSQRIAAVFTSIENLPEGQENPHQWIGEFCLTCMKCVRTCPGQAIWEEKPRAEDGGPIHIDYKKCAVPFSNSMGCSVCIKECVFFQGDYERIKSLFLR